MLKKVSTLLGFGLLVALPSAFAAPCGSGVLLSTWLTPGFSCSVGDKTFSNFTYTDSSTGGALAIPATGVTVTTVGPAGSGATVVGPNIGLQFNAGWSANAGQETDAAIGFTVTVSSGPQLITDLGLAQVSGILAPGTASVVELACGTSTTCTPNAFSTITLQNSTTTSVSSTTLLNAQFGFLNVMKDIDVNGGSTGFADLSLVTDTFSQTAVPEPVSLSLLGGGLAFLGLARWRRSGKKA